MGQGIATYLVNEVRVRTCRYARTLFLDAYSCLSSCFFLTSSWRLFLASSCSLSEGLSWLASGETEAAPVASDGDERVESGGGCTKRDNHV